MVHRGENIHHKSALQSSAAEEIDDKFNESSSQNGNKYKNLDEKSCLCLCIVHESDAVFARSKHRWGKNTRRWWGKRDN